MFNPATLVSFLSHFTYPGVAIYMSTLGYIIPIPEEMVLLILGYLAGIGKFHFWVVFVVSLAGVLIGDNILYWLSYRESRYILKFTERIKKETVQKFEGLMAGNIGTTLLLLRFFIGFRFLGPVIAGSLKVRWRRFFIYDTLIVTGYIGFFLYLGYFFRRRLFFVVGVIEQFRSFFLIIVLLALLAYLFRRVLVKEDIQSRS